MHTYVCLAHRSSDVPTLVHEILEREPLISPKREEQVASLITSQCMENRIVLFIEYNCVVYCYVMMCQF